MDIVSVFHLYSTVQAGNVPETELCIIKIRFFSRNIKYLRKNGIFLFLLLLLLAAVHAEGKAAVSSCFMEQILQPTPSLLTSSTSPSSLHCPFNQLPSPPSSSMILFASSIFPFSSHVGCNPTLLLFMELPQLFPLQPRPNLSNKSFSLQISTTGKE